MATEIERKWLARPDVAPPFALAKAKYDIKQCYMWNSPNLTLRLRASNDNFIFTMKGKSSEDGLERSEKECSVWGFIAKPIMWLLRNRTLSKTRWVIPYKKQDFEVDVFDGRHLGLTLIELELKTRAIRVKKPKWVGKEVTGDVAYYNASIIKRK
ncbi:Adenylate cyclase [Vibrio chagasii]|nr:Adenylate cyclase [Vibrio chagasii]